MSLSRAGEIGPPGAKSAAVNPPAPPPGSAGRSVPALAAATASRTANPKSGATNPLKSMPFSRSPSVVGF